MALLNTTNPEQLIYNNNLIQLTVLGGIKLEGLDRMRATLKAELPESPRPPIRHNLDLYNDSQCEKMIRKIAERLEIGTRVISASLSELTAQLENYRLEKLKEQAPEEIQIKALSKDEQLQAEDYLQQENLIEQTKLDLSNSGIIGEEINALILFLAMSSRKCMDPLSVVCLAKSGQGKSYLMEKVAACMPIEDLLENTQMTENSFYYYKKEEIKGKVFLIEDLDGAEAVLYPIRELQSKKRITKTVTTKDKNGINKTVTLTVEGPVSVIGCTTKERIYEDNANRSILIYLDGSKTQDEKILEYQKQIKAGLINKQIETTTQSKLQDVQRLLEPIKIVNPYALLIDLPKEIFKPRRTMGLLLNFIEAVTYYHQYQREQLVSPTTGEIFIETHPQDIKIAFELLQETLFRKSDELSGACRSFYGALKRMKLDKFYASDIRQHSRINPRTLQRHLKELNDYNYLKIIGGNKYQTGYQYELNPLAEKVKLEQEINKQIKAIQNSIEQEAKQRNKRK